MLLSDELLEANSLPSAAFFMPTSLPPSHARFRCEHFRTIFLGLHDKIPYDSFSPLRTQLGNKGWSVPSDGVRYLAEEVKKDEGKATPAAAEKKPAAAEKSAAKKSA